MSKSPEIPVALPGNATSVSHRLLLVDDERLVLATLTRGLEAAGFAVVTAESVTEAEELLAGGTHPDLAIIDVMMPERSGLELARRLQELDHIPFILLTATADARVVEQATQNGALGYVVKPVDVPNLVPTIKAALARSEDLQDFRMTQRQLQEALDADRDINVAIGIVMVRQQLDRNDAFEQLRKTARARRLKLSALANELITTADR
jgi:AmiR/NasT family two-component response regulator